MVQSKVRLIFYVIIIQVKLFNIFLGNYLNFKKIKGKYITDFTYIDTNEISLNGEVVFKDMINIDLCSFECINSDGFNCKSFDYCADSKTCILNSGQKPVESAINLNKTDKCAHYRSNFF